MPGNVTIALVSEKLMEEQQYDVSSSNPEVRVKARRQRLARRLENIRRLQLQQENEDADLNFAEGEVDKSIVQKQIEKSADVLEKLVLESEEIITNVRVANDGREVDRRENEGIIREKIIKELEDEAKAAQGMFNEIANKWITIYNYSDPLAIHEELLAQKEKCDELITQKDGIIAMLKEDIKRTEIQFSEDQARQNEDISTLTHRIEDQISLLRKAYMDELEIMEGVITFERELLIKANDQKWEDLYRQRDELETANIDLRYTNDQMHINKMIELRINHEELQRKTRIMLETDINKMQQEMECIKALCLLNSEKLDYNYQILAKREDENLIIKSQQKRRINKLSDLINDYKSKISNLSKKSHLELKRVQQQVVSLRKGVKDTEMKLEHFSKNNDVKYKKIWELNYKKAESLLMRILKVDRVIYEQQLGKEWIGPQLHLLKMEDLNSYKKAFKMLNYTTSKGSKNISSGHSSETESTEFKRKVSGVDKYYSIHCNKLLQHILKLISDKSGFLVEKRLKTILRDYESDPRYLIRIDCLFSALGVASKHDVDDLIRFFLPYSKCEECQKSLSVASLEKEIKVEILEMVTYEEESQNLTNFMNKAVEAVQEPNSKIESILLKLMPQEEEIIEMSPSSIGSNPSLQRSFPYKATMRILCHKQHPLLVNPGFVLRALSDFISHYYQVADKTGNTTNQSTTLINNPTISRLLKQEDVLEFWNRFRVIYSPANDQVWNGILKGLQTYLLILKDRKQLNDEIVGLRRQNLELKHLLASYMEEYESHAPCNKPNQIIPKIFVEFD